MTLSTSSPRAKRRWAVLGALVVVLTVLGSMAALAVNSTGAFELDGDATNAAGTAGDDWDNVCHEVLGSDCSTTSDTSGATAVSWLAESDPSASIFTGGGSKDPEDPQDSWLWKDEGGLPDKDNLLHGFAARYSLTPNATTCPAGSFPTCEVIFFGSDRFANDGDAVQGFWFFQNKIEKTDTAAGGGFKFSGHHKNGDLLIISDFSNGGSVSTIFVHKWDSTCTKAANNNPQPNQCSAANLRLLASSTAANCNSSAATAGFCGIVNTSEAPVTSPWSFLDKDGSAAFRQGEFFEGGVNLSTLGLGSECFASVASETRSSTSPTATLKDFVLDSFGECETTLVTTPKTGAATPANLAADSNSNNLVEISIGTGSVTVKDSAVLTVSGVPSFTGTLSFNICGPITTPTACATGGVPAGSSTVTTSGTYTSNAVTLTSAGRYCWRSDFDSGTNGVPDASDSTVESAGKTGECFEVLPVQTTLDTQAVASPVDFGQPVQDNATLGNTATQPGTDGGVDGTYLSINATNGAAAGGKITFTLLKADCTTLATGTGTNPQDFTPISGDGTYGPVSFTPDAPGTYHWKAQYLPAAGDVNNLGSTHNAACGDTDETVVVSQAPTGITTRQFVYPQDKAVITATGGGALAGSVTFKLFDSSTNCTNGANATTVGQNGLLYIEGPLSVSGNSPQAKTTSNTTVRIASDAIVYWRVTYTSTNQAQLGSSSVCVESTDVDYTGDDGTISIP